MLRFLCECTGGQRCLGGHCGGLGVVDWMRQGAQAWVVKLLAVVIIDVTSDQTRDSSSLHDFPFKYPSAIYLFFLRPFWHSFCWFMPSPIEINTYMYECMRTQDSALAMLAKYTYIQLNLQAPHVHEHDIMYIHECCNVKATQFVPCSLSTLRAAAMWHSMRTMRCKDDGIFRLNVYDQAYFCIAGSASYRFSSFRCMQRMWRSFVCSYVFMKVANRRGEGFCFLLFLLQIDWTVS